MHACEMVDSNEPLSLTYTKRQLDILTKVKPLVGLDFCNVIGTLAHGPLSVVAGTRLSYRVLSMAAHFHAALTVARMSSMFSQIEL